MQATQARHQSIESPFSLDRRAGSKVASAEHCSHHSGPGDSNHLEEKDNYGSELLFSSEVSARGDRLLGNIGSVTKPGGHVAGQGNRST